MSNITPFPKINSKLPIGKYGNPKYSNFASRQLI